MQKFSSQEVPDKPGVYVFRNRAGQVIYVGKAKSLRRRLSSYFQPSRARTADVKLRALINSIASHEFFVVRSESDALVLESQLIKQYHPRYNVELRDDKRFLLLAVDRAELYPRLVLTRLRKQDGREYFGPFPRSGKLRQTVSFLSARFGLRTCAGKTPDAETHRHCVERVIRVCCCPCIGRVTAAEYGARLEAALGVLRGDIGELVAELESGMRQFAAARRFEKAAELRDIIENLRSVCGSGFRQFRQPGLPAAPGAGDEGVAALQEALGLAAAPKLIECLDISNISGRLAVGSVVCFADGAPRRQRYRRYKIRGVEGADDFAMLQEVAARHYGREDAQPCDLVVVDGGAGQVAAVLAALVSLGRGGMPLIGLAKRLEEIYVPGRSRPLLLPAHHPGLRLLQRLRDEAHRFAVSYHRHLRNRRIADSILAEIPGVGEKRRVELLKIFGSVNRIRRLDAAGLAAGMPGLGPVLATRICEYLRQHGGGQGAPAQANPAT